MIDALLPVKSVDEVVICGPEAMIKAAQKTLIEAGVPESRIYTERFTANTPQPKGVVPIGTLHPEIESVKSVALSVILEGMEHEMMMALNAGLDLPFWCRAGVCCTCQARPTSGRLLVSFDER